MPSHAARRLPVVALGLTATLACQSLPRNPTAPTPSLATVSGAPSATLTEAAAVAATGWTRCGELACHRFPSAADAFRTVLAEHPLVLGIGETHAQAGDPAVRSSTMRFTTELMPLLADLASDLILELWVADGTCGQVEQQAAETQHPVTAPQRDTNQSEFVTLGHRAHELGLKPHVLRPSCAEYERVVSAGADGVVELLTLIAQHSEALIAATLQRNRAQGVERMVVAYGGAMHNDLAPREGREDWSFGPSVSHHTGDRYVELDLIVPEFIKDTEIWRALPWYAHFDPTLHPDEVTLLRVRPRSYVLVFARSGPDPR